MKILKLSALLLGVVLFTGIGATTLSAEGMKCGAGKCGSSMKKPAAKCEKCEKSEKCECGEDKSNCKCEKSEKCESCKKDAPKKAMKCGAGKCGGNK